MRDNSTWFLREPPRSQATLRLFCFPYAGGAAAIYRHWGAQLSPQVDVVRVELPGRGKRLDEPPFRNLPALIKELARVIAPLLDINFAFFGHSMGAIIAFELARELRRKNMPQPRQLLVSGRQAPQLGSRHRILYNLPDEELRAELSRLNGIPSEVFGHPELMNLLLPLLRADFELIQTYAYMAEPPLTCGIAAYGGLEDNKVPRELLLPWGQQTDGEFSLQMLPGDHFFLRSASRLLLESLGRELDRPALATNQSAL